MIKGTRVTLAQVLAELAEGAPVSEIAAELDVDTTMLQKALEGLSLHLDRPFTK